MLVLAVAQIVAFSLTDKYSLGQTDVEQSDNGKGGNSTRIEYQFGAFSMLKKYVPSSCTTLEECNKIAALLQLISLFQFSSLVSTASSPL
mgnify:CR=1 FL=1